MKRFAGKAAIVTGAAQGIGRASAERLGREGARVMLLDRNAPVLAEAVEALRSSGIEAEGHACDVADPDAVSTAVEASVEGFGRLDVVHANAGVLLPASLGEESLERWERTLSINVTGVFLTLRAAIPHLLADGGGAIVTTGSTAGLVAEPDFVGYCTSKAAVNHMTRQIALDYAGRGLRANAVCPGWIATAFSDPLLQGMSQEEIDRAVEAIVPMGRQGSPEEVAAAVAYLASDDASYVTGHCLVLDGGLTVR